MRKCWLYTVRQTRPSLRWVKKSCGNFHFTFETVSRERLIYILISMCNFSNVNSRFLVLMYQNHKAYIFELSSEALKALLFRHLCPCRTAYGKEYEVTAHTFLDSHKSEQDVNHWIICTSDPAGSKLELVNNTPASADNTDCTQTN